MSNLNLKQILKWDAHDLKTLRDVFMSNTILHDLDESDEIDGVDLHYAFKDIAKGANYAHHIMKNQDNSDSLAHVIEDLT